MAQIEANSLHVAIFERVLIDRGPVLAEVARRIDVRAAMIRHGDEHHAVAVDVAGFRKGLFVGLPDPVNDRRLSRIGRRSMIEVPAQVDDSHFFLLPRGPTRCPAGRNAVAPGSALYRAAARTAPAALRRGGADGRWHGTSLQAPPAR